MILGFEKHLGLDSFIIYTNLYKFINAVFIIFLSTNTPTVYLFINF